MAIDYHNLILDNTNDIVHEPQFDLFFNNGEEERIEPGTLRVLSLFSGCGGMDLGLEGGFICHSKSAPNNEAIEYVVNENWVMLRRNVFRTIFACDILEDAKKSWIQYMSRYHINPDIYHLTSIVDLVKFHKNGYPVFPNNIDVVTGGFPCQDFSVSGLRMGFDSTVSHNGKKVINDDEANRGKLYTWMKEVINIVRPKMFIAENVKGMVSLGDAVQVIRRDFTHAGEDGYIVLDPRVLHAGAYGVPETRERVIFIGIRREGLNRDILEMIERGELPEELNPYPSPTHRLLGEKESNNHLKRAVTCRDVLANLPEPNESNDPSQQEYSRAKFQDNNSQGQSEIDMDGYGPTIRSEHHGNIEYRRLSEEHGGRNVDEFERGLTERRLTPRECALIQTFPPDYQFVSRKRNSTRYFVSPSGAYRVIGNAVPPMLAYNIGRKIQQVLPQYFD